MLRNLNLIHRLIRLFGTWSGIQLFLQLKTKRLENIRLPNVQYPIALRKGTSDTATFKQVFLEREYDIPFDPHTRVVVDAGANIGLFTVWMKSKFRDATFICLEPDDDNFRQLKINTSGYTSVHLAHCGLWNKPTRLHIHDKFNMGKWAMVVEENPEHGNIEALSIADIMEQHRLERIDVLKIDIETSEKTVFASGYETWMPRVKMLVIELHDWMEADCARPFFKAVQQCYRNYTYLIRGENTIIINNDLD